MNIKMVAASKSLGKPVIIPRKTATFLGIFFYQRKEKMIYSFDSEIAKKYGVNEAIMIANFQFWIKKNKANQKNFFDGHYWTYNSKKAFMELFDFWGEQSIKTILNHLKEKGVLITANYNNSPYDRTLWYAFADEEKWIGGNEIFQKLELTNGKFETNQPIPDIIPDNIPDIYIQKQKNEKVGYGEFNNVMLTKEEIKKLIDKYGLLFQDAVELLSNYLASVGKNKYKSHYAVMKENGWVWERVHKNPNNMKKLQLIADGNGGYREETIEEYYKRTMNLNLE